MQALYYIILYIHIHEAEVIHYEKQTCTSSGDGIISQSIRPGIFEKCRDQPPHYAGYFCPRQMGGNAGGDISC